MACIDDYYPATLWVSIHLQPGVKSADFLKEMNSNINWNNNNKFMLEHYTGLLDTGHSKWYYGVELPGDNDLVSLASIEWTPCDNGVVSGMLELHYPDDLEGEYREEEVEDNVEAEDMIGVERKAVNPHDIPTPIEINSAFIRDLRPFLMGLRHKVKSIEFGEWWTDNDDECPVCGATVLNRGEYMGCSKCEWFKEIT